jgi:phenylpropionate dioxygenase-like ring-hydroxylating dioxygenase large terminal subunit
MSETSEDEPHSLSHGPGVDPGFRPGEWAVRPDLAEDAPECKSPPLSVLYPEKDDYLLLSPDRYTDRDFMRREWDAVWSRAWTCAGLVSDVVEAGDWIRYDLGPESFLVVRGRDGVLRAFHNVCRHRGRRIVEDEAGHAATFVCRFHNWIYGLDGGNLRVSDRELFAPPTLCGDLGLAPVRCEIWGAFVFVCMDPGAPPLDETLNPLAELLEAYQIDAMHPVKDVSVAVECNWKVACEAFLEPYHTHATHPQIIGSIDELYNQYDFYPNGHSRVISPLGRPSPRLGPLKGLNADLAGVLAAAGIDPERFAGGPGNVRAALRTVKRRTENPFGLDYSSLSDDQLVDNWNPSFFPNLAMNVLPESVQVMRFLPHPTNPARCWFHVWTLMPRTRPGVRPTAFFGVEEDADLMGRTRPERRHTTQDAPELGDVLEQDVANMPLVQQGLASSACDALRLSEQEQRIQQLHAEIDRRIEALD